MTSEGRTAFGVFECVGMAQISQKTLVARCVLSSSDKSYNWMEGKPIIKSDVTSLQTKALNHTCL